MSEETENDGEVGTNTTGAATMEDSNIEIVHEVEDSVFNSLVSLIESRMHIKKKEKTQLLLGFTNLDLASLQDCVAKKDLIAIREAAFGSAQPNVAARNRNWTPYYMACKLANIYCRYSEFKEQMGAQKSRRPNLRQRKKSLTNSTVIQSLDTLNNKFDGILAIEEERIVAEQMQLSRKTQKKANAMLEGTTGPRPQDFVEFDQEKVEKDACPACGHSCCMATDTAEDIKRQNDAIAAEHQARLDQWNAKTDKSKRSRPRKGKTKEQTIACSCY